MMPWIESHTELAQHPKTLRLARRLGISIPLAIGHLHLLWWWALQYSKDGDLSPFDDIEIATACLWEGEPSAIREALIAAGFVDACGVVHDWRDYCGKLLDQRRANAERQARWRDRHRDTGSESDVTVTSPLRNAATVPNLTVPTVKESSTTPMGSGRVREADASLPPKTRGNVKVAALIDALRAEGMSGALTGRDRRAVNETPHEPAQVASLYAAIFRGEYGDTWMHDNLSVALCLEKLPGWLSHQEGHRAPERRNGTAPRSASSRVTDVFREAMYGSTAGTAEQPGHRGDADVGLRQVRRSLPGEFPG